MAKRHLGQHFLSDPRILDRIAAALDAGPLDRCLEIGPGRGGLTRALVGRGLRVAAVERDRDLIQPLREQWPDVKIIEGDALEIDWLEAVGAGAGERWFVIGNIPYNITSPLIDKALEPPRPTRIVFLVQREVADRLNADPGTHDYGALTVGVHAAARVERLFTVGAGSFRPRPKVDSAVVRITPLNETLVHSDEVTRFRRFVTALFGARRKQLGRALRTALDIEPDVAGSALAALAIDPTRRPETLSVPEFVQLFRLLVDANPTRV